MFDLYDFKDRHLRQVRSLTESEYTAFREAVVRLRRFRRWERTLGAVRRNQEEFAAGLSQVPQTLVGTPLLADAHDQIDEEANRLLQNYLASFRFFLDLTETRLKRLYSATSPIVASFKTATATAFDRTLEYRLLYRLRTYAQHLGAPIGHVVVRADATRPGDSRPTRSAALHLDVSELLAQWDGWGPVEKDLRAGPALLDVSPMLEPVWTELQFIRAAVAAGERTALLSDATVVEHMFAPVVAAGGVPAVGILKPGSAGQQTTVDLVQPPADVLKSLGVSYTPIVL